MPDYKTLYDNLIGSGKVKQDELGDLETFNQMMTDSQSVVNLHRNLASRGFTVDDIGSQEDFLYNVNPEWKSEPQVEQPPVQRQAANIDDNTQQVEVPEDDYWEKMASESASPVDNLRMGWKSGVENLKGGIKYAAATVGQTVDRLDDENDMAWDDKLLISARKNFEAAPEGKGIWYQLGSFAPQMIGIAAASVSAPMTGGTSLAALPGIIGGANIAMLVGSAAGSGMKTYDDYMAETGQEGDDLARLGVGAAVGAMEMIAERAGLSRYMPAGVVSRAVTKFFKETPELAGRLGRKLVGNNPSLLKDFAFKTIGNAIDEGDEEALTEAGNILIESLYKDKEDLGTFREMVGRISESWQGGALMGVVLGPVTYGSDQAYKRKMAVGIDGTNYVPASTDRYGNVTLTGLNDNFTESGEQRIVSARDFQYYSQVPQMQEYYDAYVESASSSLDRLAEQAAAAGNTDQSNRILQKKEEFLADPLSYVTNEKTRRLENGMEPDAEDEYFIRTANKLQNHKPDTERDIFISNTKADLAEMSHEDGTFKVFRKVGDNSTPLYLLEGGQNDKTGIVIYTDGSRDRRGRLIKKSMGYSDIAEILPTTQEEALAEALAKYDGQVVINQQIQAQEVAAQVAAQDISSWQAGMNVEYAGKQYNVVEEDKDKATGQDVWILAPLEGGQMISVLKQQPPVVNADGNIAATTENGTAPETGQAPGQANVTDVTESAPVTEQPQVPTLEDGSPDYDAILLQDPQMYLDELAKEFEPEEIVQGLQTQANALVAQIEKAQGKLEQATSATEWAKQNKEVKRLKAQAAAVDNALTLANNPTQAAANVDTNVTQEGTNVQSGLTENVTNNPNQAQELAETQAQQAATQAQVAESVTPEITENVTAPGGVVDTNVTQSTPLEGSIGESEQVQIQADLDQIRMKVNTPGMTSHAKFDEVKKAVAYLQQKYLAGKVTVVRTRKDLFDAYKSIVGEARAESSLMFFAKKRIPGFYINGQVIMCSDNIANDVELLETFVHEGMHLASAINGVDGTLFDAVGEPAMRAIVPSTYFEDGIDRLMLSDEAVSHLSEVIARDPALMAKFLAGGDMADIFYEAARKAGVDETSSAILDQVIKNNINTLRNGTNETPGRDTGRRDKVTRDDDAGGGENVRDGSDKGQNESGGGVPQSSGNNAGESGSESESDVEAERNRAEIKPETSAAYAFLTEDGDNYVFFHVSNEEFNTTDPTKAGANRATSPAERAAIAKTGMSMFYTMPVQGESMVKGANRYEVKVKKNKVYDISRDPLGLAKEAKARHDQDNPNSSYGPNDESAYITLLANEKGYEMAVIRWGDVVRAQSTLPTPVTKYAVSRGDTIISGGGKYRSNKDLGWHPVWPVSSEDIKRVVFDKIHNAYSRVKNYGALYNIKQQLFYDFGAQYSPFKSQEQMDKAVEESTILTEDIKKEYKAAMESNGTPGYSYHIRQTEEWFDNAVNNIEQAKADFSKVDSTLKSGQFAMLSGENPGGKPQDDKSNEAANKRVQEWLTAQGLEYDPVVGRYGGFGEHSYLVYGMNQQQVEDFFAAGFGQEAVATDKGMFFEDGSFHPRNAGVTYAPVVPGMDYASVIQTSDGVKHGFSLDYDFGVKINPKANPDPEIGDGPVEGRAKIAEQLSEADIAHLDEMAKNDVENRVVAGTVVSTRTPGGKSAPGDVHTTSNYDLGWDNYQSVDKPYIFNANTIADYPIVAGTISPRDRAILRKAAENFGKDGDKEAVAAGRKVADKVYESFIDMAVNNLLWLHDQMDPKVRKIARRWYDGGNEIARGLAEKYGITQDQAAAVIALHSPKKDWFRNISIAERVIDIYMTKMDTPITQEMVDKYIDLEYNPLKLPKETNEQYDKRRAAKRDAAKSGTNGYVGKKMSDVEMMSQMIRAYDEVYNSRDHYIYSPNGEKLGFVMNNAGTKRVSAGWGSYGEIEKAISVLQNGTQEAISIALGNEHKVRNFFNNITDPHNVSPFVTIDTHAVAAALLKPLSGTSPEVTTNFGGKGSSNTNVTGISGTYAIFYEAYRRAAEARGIQPRQMQSITWEAVRGLYEKESKTSKNEQSLTSKVDYIWDEYVNGNISEDELRERIIEAAGGIQIPSWARSDSRNVNEAESSTDKGKLQGDGTVRAAGRAGRRVSGNRKPGLAGTPSGVDLLDDVLDKIGVELENPVPMDGDVFGPTKITDGETYTTQDGTEIRFKVMDPVSGKKKKATPWVAEENDIYTGMERQLNENKFVSLIGPESIKSPNDVAYLFRHLEDAATENAFVVHHLPRGKYLVQYLGTGSAQGVHVDAKHVAAAAKEFGSVSVTFVHNHPSGTMAASDADMNMHKLVTNACEGTCRVEDSVIIDTDKGQYAVFNSGAYQAMEKQAVEGSDLKVPVYSFDKQVLYTKSDQMDHISGSPDVGKVMSKIKRGSEKYVVLILNNQNRVTRVFLTDATPTKADIMPMIGKHGERVIIGSSNNVMAPYSAANLARELKDANTSLLDWVIVESDPGISSAYKSMADEGMLREPEAKVDNIRMKVAEAAAQVNTDPTEGQKEAGNYSKGHVTIDGMDISIENPAGSTRSGKDKSGKEWSIEMKSHYGYFKGTSGKDGDQIDVFINPAIESAETVYVVDQDQDGQFDESKVMLGYDSADEAMQAYLSNYDKGWGKNIRAISEVSQKDFKNWLYDGARQRKPYAEYKDARFKLSDTIEVDGKERSTTNSNGRLIHPTEEGIRNFWRWFGDSKVVDEQGRPLVVYHGGSFNESDSRGMVGDSWFTVTKRDASYYAKQSGGSTTSAYLSIQTPLFVGDVSSLNLPISDEVLISLKKRGNSNSIVIDGKHITFIEPNAGVLLAKDIGRDGIIELRSREIMDVVVWNSSQIKSTTGNAGTFSPETGDIRFKVAEPKPGAPALSDLPRFKFIGTTGAAKMDNSVAILSQLNQAVFMHTHRVGAEEIKFATGWELGKDGKWRYELSDHDTKLNLKMSDMDTDSKDFKLGEIYEDKDLFRMWPKMKDMPVSVQIVPGSSTGEASYSPQNGITLYINQYDREKHIKNLERIEIFNNLPTQVRDIVLKYIDVQAKLNAEAAAGKFESFTDRWDREMELYPTAENIADRKVLGQFGYADLKDGFYTYNDKFLTAIIAAENMALNEDMLKQDPLFDLEESIKPTLLHELQHAIQHIEGFASGGNMNIARDNMTTEQESNYMDALKDSAEAKAEAQQSGILWYEDSNIMDRVLKPMRILEDVYRSIAGEVEARNTATRTKMTPQERSLSLGIKTEDVDRKSQLVLPSRFAASQWQNRTPLEQSLELADRKIDNKVRFKVTEAKATFGTTTDFREAGWLLTDGDMLDFSGKKDGGPKGERTMDHGEIKDIDTTWEEFMNAGHIRMIPEIGGINISKAPTAKQKAVLKQYINALKSGRISDFDGVSVDFSREDGTVVHAAKYQPFANTDRIVNDIDRYYTDGIKPTPRFKMIDVDGVSRSTENSQGRPIHPTEEGIRNFWRWFGDSKVVDEQGRPLVTYRGEHGDGDRGPQTNLGSITFSSDAGVASMYAERPNDRAIYNKAESPRVMPAYLSIKNPIINNIRDPFIDLSLIIDKIGEKEAERFARKHAVDIEETDNWYENYNGKYDGVNDLLNKNPKEISNLYLYTYRLLDDIEFVDVIKNNGYDGAIHGNPSSDTVEYRVLDNGQAKSAIGNDGSFNPADKDIRFKVAETITVDGKERPTTNSNGQQIHPTEEGIRNFYKWFGESKVVDEQGRPMVMYHATGSDFNEFYPFVYLTKDPLYAEKIGEALVSQTVLGIPRGLSIMPVYAKIENYADFRHLGDEKVYSASEFIDGLRKSSIEEEIINKIKREVAGYEILRPPYGWVTALRGVLSDSLSEGGYSGIVLKEYTANWNKEGKQSRIYTDAYVAFSPDQIKSATGNNGNFDPTDPDIRYKVFEDDTPLGRAINKAAAQVEDPNPLNRAMFKVGDALDDAANINKSPTRDSREFSEIWDQVHQYLQDRDLPIRRLEEAVRKAGGKVNNASKAYRDKKLAPGRLQERIDQFHDSKMKPVYNTINKLVRAGVPESYITPYLIAKHAIERNPFLRDRAMEKWIKEQAAADKIDVDAWKIANQDKIDDHRKKLDEQDFSGVLAMDGADQWKNNPDEFAKHLVDLFETEAPAALVAELNRNVQSASSHILEIWRDSHAISTADYNAYKARFQHFVPLRGWKEDQAKLYSYVPGGGKGKSIKYAKGRTSLSENPLAYIEKTTFQAMGEQAENEYKRSMLWLIINNRDMTSLFSLKRAYYVKTAIQDPENPGEYLWTATTERPEQALFDSGDASFVHYKEHMRLVSPENAAQNEVLVNTENGSFAMVFPKKQLEVAQALNNKNYMYAIFGNTPKDSRKVTFGVFQSRLESISRFMKAMFTQWNVVFPVTNWTRDIQEGSLTRWVRGGSGVGVFVAQKKAMPAVFRRIHGKSAKTAEGQKYDKMLQEFYDNGGATGYTRDQDIEGYEKQMSREVSDQVASGTIKSITPGRALRRLGKGIGSFNQFFEDGVRFAVYVEAINSGMTPQDAAYEARTATVDFNTTGKATRFYEAVWNFFKVSMNSLDKNTQLFTNKKSRKRAVATATSFMMVGFLEAMANHLWADDEDDKEDDYYNISRWMRHNYLVIPGPGNKYFSIALPQFWRTFKSMGTILYDVTVAGKTKPLEGLGQLLGNFTASLTPVDFGGFYQNGEFSLAPIVPSALRPVAEIAYNRNFMGSPIAIEPFTKAQERILAQNGLGKSNVHVAAKYVSDVLFRWGGGDNDTRWYTKNGEDHQVPWLMDINPSKLEHLVGAYTGGTGRFIGNAIHTAINGWKTEDGENDFRKVPYVSAIVRQIPESKWQTIREYQDLRKSISYRDPLEREYKRKMGEDPATYEPKYNEFMSNDYAMELQEVLDKAEKDLEEASAAYDFKTKEGAEEITRIMQEVIDYEKELKERYK